MTKEEAEENERRYVKYMAERPKGAVPVGACIPWPRAKGVIGLSSKPDPEADQIGSED